MRDGNLLRVAVVGSGPAGFYAAGHLLKQAPGPVEVDVLDRLPTPFGLVRGGVAPDHPKIKSVTRVYEKTAALPGFRFFGNVEVGRDLSHDELAAWYDAVVYAVGTASDRRSGIPGEDLPGSWSASEFVGWYNGHPDFRDLEFDLSGEHAIVVGNGNVAVDVARMLTLTRDELAVTDIADHALDVLVASNIREIVVLGRRGPEQAAFTNPELLELGELTDADVHVDPRDLDLDDAIRERELDQTGRKKFEILRELAVRPGAGKHKRVVLRFLTSPVEILGTGKVEAVRVVRNELARTDAGGLRARATDEQEVLPASLVLRAIGYTGTPLPGVPFDARRGVIANRDGRILGEDGEIIPGAYAAGWIKRGPSGVIGTNKKDAQETVDHVLADHAAGLLEGHGRLDRRQVAGALHERVPEIVDYAGWQAIDSHEQSLGQAHGRPRVKLTRVTDLMKAAAQRRST